MSEGTSGWDDVQREEQALLSRCKKFVLGHPDSPSGESKDILYFTPCGRWFRVCTWAVYYADRIPPGLLEDYRRAEKLLFLSSRDAASVFKNARGCSGVGS
jgi:hypothetical protein